MVQYIQTMMRKEPITLLVMLLMIAILIFGLWDILHVVKRVRLQAPGLGPRAEYKNRPKPGGFFSFESSVGASRPDAGVAGGVADRRPGRGAARGQRRQHPRNPRVADPDRRHRIVACGFHHQRTAAGIGEGLQHLHRHAAAGD